MVYAIVALAVVATLVTLAILFPNKRKACLNKAKETVKGLKENIKKLKSQQHAQPEPVTDPA